MNKKEALKKMNKDGTFNWPESYKRVHFTVVNEKRFNNTAWQLKDLSNKEMYDSIKL